MNERRRLLDRDTSAKLKAMPKSAVGWGNIGASYPADDKNAGGPRGAGRLTRLDNREPAMPPASACPAPPAVADPLACLPELCDALRCFTMRTADPGMPSDDRGRVLAYRVAATLGRCRVFGVSAAGMTDAPLSPTAAAAATMELEKRAKRWCDEAKSLTAQLPRLSAAAAEDLCLGLLEARTTAWAAFVAIDECYAAALDAGAPQANSLSSALDRLFDAADALDSALEAAETHLSVPAIHQLLSNWRSLLAEPFCQTPPWWFEIPSASVHATRRARAS